MKPLHPPARGSVLVITMIMVVLARLGKAFRQRNGNPGVSQNRGDATLQISEGDACSLAPDSVV